MRAGDRVVFLGSFFGLVPGMTGVVLETVRATNEGLTRWVKVLFDGHREGSYREVREGDLRLLPPAAGSTTQGRSSYPPGRE